jgi:SpoIID/LytB domain protein
VPSGSGTTTVPATGRTYRGLVEATAARGAFELVNQVDVETYLRGMGEVRNPGWPQASLRAQAIASRTYALRAMAANGELCDDQRCQVYLGAQAEYAAMNKAVSDTKGQALFYGKSLASTVYSANGGAYSASRQEGFGTADDASYPYLRPAPYPTQDPAPWTVKVALTDVAARVGYKGTLTSVTVAQAGPSHRVLAVGLDGSAGPKSVSGLAFAKQFSLRSTLFTLRSDTADAAPPPPPVGEGLQAPPDDLRIDPNGLPPDPLTADELQRAIPSASQFTTAPTLFVRPRPVRRTAGSWPWVNLVGFLLLASVTVGVGWRLLSGPGRAGGAAPAPPETAPPVESAD